MKILPIIAIFLMSFNVGCCPHIKSPEPAWTREVCMLEAALARNPALPGARDDLVRYYYQRMVSCPDVATDLFASCQSAHFRHVTWLIENQPTAAILGRVEGSSFPLLGSFEKDHLLNIWVNAISAPSTDRAVLENALKCEILYQTDNYEIAEGIRRRLKSPTTRSSTRVSKL